MLLKKVILENVGVFRDKEEFDLESTQDKPVILFGGTNGSGKTTLFESIMFCLYGASFFDKKITKKEYEKYLARKIHRYLGARASADFAAITVIFSFYHQGKVDEYSVRRMWKDDDGKITEDLKIQKNNKELDIVEGSQWQSFIEELIPRGIAKLFFFDGEKVVKIAAEENEGIEIQSSFESLLGLDLIEQLQSDLRVSIIRKMGGNVTAIQEKLDNFNKEKQEAIEKISNFKEKIVSLDEERTTINQKIEGLETRISKVGGGYAQKRQQLNEKKTYLTMNLKIVEQNIHELCSNLLPFCTIPNELKQLEKQLNYDQDILKSQFEKEILEKNFDEIKQKINSNAFLSKIDSFGAKELVSIISDLFNEKINEISIEEKKGVINLSSLETSTILGLFDKIKNEVPKELEKNTLEYQTITEEMRKVQTALANAPKDDEIGPLISELSQLNNSLGMIQNEVEHIERQIGQEQALIKMFNAKIRIIVDEKYKNKKSNIHVELAEKVQLALDNYTIKLKIRKLELLEKYLLEAIHILLHKEHFIDKIKIDKNSFEISLYRNDDIQILKDSLSEGEKQMLATSVLWALAKTSGKPLPFIIDTPLARLDVAHRSNLVSKFFPIASHQVLIFSTDAEIDEKYYPSLKPYVHKSYYMQYQSNHGKTKIQQGYFPEVEAKLAV